jgi:hypothetical protein
MTSILGLSAFYHDSAACLVVDGKIVAAAQEERFSREKYDAAFPHQAIDFCLKEAGLSIDRLDYVAFYDKPFAKFDRLLETYFSYSPDGFRSFALAMPVWLKKKLFTRRIIRKALGRELRAPVLFLDCEGLMMTGRKFDAVRRSAAAAGVHARAASYGSGRQCSTRRGGECPPDGHFKRVLANTVPGLAATAVMLTVRVQGNRAGEPVRLLREIRPSRCSGPRDPPRVVERFRQQLADPGVRA